MDRDDMEVRLQPHYDSVRPSASGGGEPSIGELFKRLGNDTGALIRAEAALAKAEARDTAQRLAKDGAKLGTAAGLAFVGVLSLSAFVVIGLGNLLGGAYWLSALLVGTAAAGIGAVLAKNAAHDMKSRSIRPQQSMQSLREDKNWAVQQARELKHDLTTDPTAPSTRR